METPAPKAQGHRGNSPSVPPTPGRSPGLSERLLKRGDRVGPSSVPLRCPCTLPQLGSILLRGPSTTPSRRSLQEGRAGLPGPGEGAAPTWQLSATDTRPTAEQGWVSAAPAGPLSPIPAPPASCWGAISPACTPGALGSSRRGWGLNRACCHCFN